MDYQDVIVNGGKLLAELRQKSELTQQELATRAALSRSMVAQIEIGERRPSRKVIQRLCEAMAASEDNCRLLLLAYDYTPSGETPDRIETFLRADKNLLPEQVEQIAALVREAYNHALNGRVRREQDEDYEKQESRKHEE